MSAFLFRPYLLYDESDGYDVQPHGYLQYSWDFGDESALSTEKSPTHEYADAGVYTVTLTVTDSSGAQDTAEQDITVTEGSEQSDVAFGAVAVGAREIGARSIGVKVIGAR